MTFKSMTDEEIAHEERMDEFARELEKKHKMPRLKTEELKQIFPEILVIAPIKLHEIEVAIYELEEFCRNNPLHGDTLEVWWEQERRDNKMQELKKQSQRFKRFIPTLSRNGLTDAEIEVARNYPILDLVDSPRRSGNMYTVLCPMHEENTPSCKIYTDRNGFWCYGCNKGGDVIDFLMARDEIDFKTAVKQLTGVS